ncbi:MAG: aminoacyl-histidine dipeptidase [Firmicutes bacterium]|nr:aminoacyl-histidine dipeptidase [Bacillota bacterium]
MLLDSLQPREVFRFFEEISRIPRASGDEEGIARYLEDFALERGFWVMRDGVNNVVIKKPGTPGREAAPAVIIQGHMDMVCEKNEGTVHDFGHDPIELILDGDFIRANGTTLGADNGVAAAMALALLDSKDLPHPPLEVVLTAAEEIGLVGAAALDFSVLSAKYMINLDSDAEGVFFTSCAGGLQAEMLIPAGYESANPGAKAFELRVRGLAGGHSGLEIDKNRANANVLLGRALNLLAEEYGIGVASVYGGSKVNAIPREAGAVIYWAAEKNAEREAGEMKPNAAVQDSGPLRPASGMDADSAGVEGPVAGVEGPAAGEEGLAAAVAGFEKLIKAEFAAADPDISITLTEAAPGDRAFRDVESPRDGAFRDGESPLYGTFQDGESPQYRVFHDGENPRDGAFRDGENPRDGAFLNNESPRNGAFRDVENPQHGAFRDGESPRDGLPGRAFPRRVFDRATRDKLIAAILLTPNGVQAMSEDIRGLVRTSNNIGVIGQKGGFLSVCSEIRSSSASEKDFVRRKVAALAGLLGAEAEYSGDYPGWAYNPRSSLRAKLARLYADMYGAPPEETAVHAGLECGFFAERMPGLDIISFGPDCFGIHSPDERLSVSSTARVWDFLKRALAGI